MVDLALSLVRKVNEGNRCSETKRKVVKDEKGIGPPLSRGEHGIRLRFRRLFDMDADEGKRWLSIKIL